MTKCIECHKEFNPARTNYVICPECWQADYRQGQRCAATKESGLPCNAWAMRGRVFCAAHYGQGYGLFDLAVKRDMVRRYAANAGKHGQTSRGCYDDLQG